MGGLSSLGYMAFSLCLHGHVGTPLLQCGGDMIGAGGTCASGAVVSLGPLCKPEED
jgi:hypothetical protein